MNIVSTFETMFRKMSIHPFLVKSHIELNNVCIIESSQLLSSWEIGRGCFGQNYFGTCKVDNKVYPSVFKSADKSNIVSAIASFSKEIKIMSKLRNPYVASNLGMCIDTQFVALIMKASSTWTLRIALNHQTFPHATLMRLMYQVAQGMAYLHANRILHLNLGTSSIYLIAEDNATIGNFELSARLKNEDRFVSIKKNLYHDFEVEWSAPECFKLQKGYEGSDVWSFGATLWEVLSSSYNHIYENLTILESGRILRYSRSLPKPKYCSAELCTLMKNCWKYVSNLRPRFADIIEIMHVELQNVLCINLRKVRCLGETVRRRIRSSDAGQV